MQINPESELTEVGGKAYQLNRLKQFCNVPPFFIVKFDSPDEINDPNTQNALVDYYRSSRFKSVAVRSSATVEDSPQASYAGIFETVLNVEPDHLIESIRIVLDSANNQRVLEYSDAVGFDHRQIRMSIIIQEMVRSRVSGVCFTKFRADKNNLIIEACLGLGEALVSGKVTPDSYIINRDTLSIVNESIGYQKLFLTNVIAGQSTYQLVPFFKRNARKLKDSEISAIAQAGLNIERQLSIIPADIEWSYEEDVLYILQARTYTGLRF